MTIQVNKTLGVVNWAQFAPDPPLFTKEPAASRPTKVQRNGQVYEEKAQTHIEEVVLRYNEKCDENEQLTYIRSPWLIYKIAGEPTYHNHFCQPDGLLVNLKEKRVTIVEVKLQHTPNAWWQIKQLYEPVLRALYPAFTFHALEVVRWMDAHTAFPGPVFFAKDIFCTQDGKFCVNIFYPRRAKQK